MSARVDFLAEDALRRHKEEADQILVPKAAVARRGELDVVFVVEGHHLRMTPVRLGEPRQDDFVLLSGPPVGARVVKNPAPTLASGQRIQVEG
jgi:hypothetical protein